MQIYKRVCNVCGKTFNTIIGGAWPDAQQGLSIMQMLGYESRHDGECLQIDVCNACVDAFIDHVALICAIPPIPECDEMKEGE